MSKALTRTDYQFKGQKSVYHGKVRDVYNIDDDLMVMVATDRISAFDVILPKGIPFKGQVLNQIAAKFLDATADICPNWKLATPDPMVTVGLKCEGFRVEMIIRGYLTGSAWRDYKAGCRNLCGNILPEGMKARIITSVDETGHPTYVTVADGYANTELEKMAEEGITTNRVPAGSAVMLQIDESDQPQTKYLILDTPTRSIVGQTNLLCGSDTATQTDGGDFFYRLTYNTSGVDVGWYWAANEGTAFTTNPHECWLALPAATGRNFSYVQIPTYEDPTGIETVKNGEWRMDNSVFDLSGRRISTDVNSTIQSTLKKGIYIINGKKTIIK